jgi:nucleoside-diphosphate-sugar epimerase
MEAPMKVGIVGCGLNSNYHINFSRNYEGAVIVGVADADEAKARSCADKMGARAYRTVGDLLEEEKPQVIHVVTPPKSHYDIAVQAIRLGCNLIIEKPMALSLREAEDLYALAERRSVKICPMHNHFFDPCMMRARKAVDEGRLGQIIGIESYYGINTHIDAFRKYPAPNALPWLYNLPGGVYHDFLPHPLYVMLPYTGKPEEVRVMEKSFGTLPQRMTDELRVLIKGERCFGSMTFSFAANPHLHFVRIYGTKMMAQVDFNTMTCVFHPVSALPKAAQKATYNLTESLQLAKETMSNVWKFARGRLRPYQGMEALIHRFYDAVSEKGPLPVTKTDALRVVGTTGVILGRIKGNKLSFETLLPMKAYRPKNGKKRVLVTGASGFLGRRLTELCIEDGYDVRALVRKLSGAERLKELGAEVFFGDVADLTSVEAAFEAVDLVVHAAADTAGDEREGPISTVQGTKNVLRMCRKFDIKRLVYISSCNVYEIATAGKGASIREDSMIERFPERRGAYTEAKLEAERLVLEAIESEEVQAVCLRPGTIFGPEGEVFTPMMGFAAGAKVFLIIGSGRFVLPFVYIDNLIHAILAALTNPNASGRTYNVVDPYRVTKKDYVEKILKKLYPKAKYVYMPYPFMHSVVLMQELLCRILKRKPFLTRYRLISSQKSILYSSERIEKELEWRPVVALDDAVSEIIEYKQRQKLADSMEAERIVADGTKEPLMEETLASTN